MSMQALLRKLDRFLGPQCTWNFESVCFNGQSPYLFSSSRDWFEQISGVDLMRTDARCPVEFEMTEEHGSVSSMFLRFTNGNAWKATNLHMMNTPDVYNLYKDGSNRQLFIQVDENESTKLNVSFKGDVPDPQNIGDSRETKFDIDFEKIIPCDIQFTFKNFAYSRQNMKTQENAEWFEAISGVDIEHLFRYQATVAIRQNMSGDSEAKLNFGASGNFSWRATLNVNDTELLCEMFKNESCSYLDIAVNISSSDNLTVNFPGSVFRRYENGSSEMEGIRIKVDFVRG